MIFFLDLIDTCVIWQIWFTLNVILYVIMHCYVAICNCMVHGRAYMYRVAVLPQVILDVLTCYRAAIQNVL